MAVDPTAKDFTDNLHTGFRVKRENVSPVELDLVDVKIRISETTERAGMERFSIFFRGPSNAFLPQSTYELSHEKLGTLHIFLVPIAQDGLGYEYEAVFNRFVMCE